jgi:hypothetical protein
MKPEQNLQTMTIEDINAETTIKKQSGDGFEFSTFLWVGALIVFFIYMLHD